VDKSSGGKISLWLRELLSSIVDISVDVLDMEAICRNISDDSVVD